VAAVSERHAALRAYEAAALTVEPLRNDLSLRRGNQINPLTYRESVGRLFLELADLRLRRASSMPQAEASAELSRARDTVEQLKFAQLEDYFREECFSTLRPKERGIDQVAANTAVIYIVPLEGRIELLAGKRRQAAV
jgi:CHAT domain-containing protein